jgi:glycosyltransferase involved in cell wall biosynthesis
MKILCLLDSVVKPGDRWLWKYLPANEDQVDFLTTTGFVERFAKWGKIISYYPAFWRSGIQALLKTRRESYDLIVAWEGKNGFPYAVLRSLFGQKTPPLIILTFNMRGVFTRFLSLARFGLRSASRIVVITPGEVERYQQMLSLPPGVVTYFPLGWYDPMQWYDPHSGRQTAALAQAGSFAYASGRTSRDYATLARAVAGTEAAVKVSGQVFNMAGVALPKNLASTGWLPYREMQNYMYHCLFYIVPLQRTEYVAGETSFLHAMSFGKAIVATRAPGTEAYIEHGVTGLLVEPGDVDGMRQAILQLWRHPDDAVRMGQAARRRFEENHTIDKFAQHVYRVALDVCQPRRA